MQAPEELTGEGTSRSKIISADAQLQVPFVAYNQRLRYISGWRAQWNRSALVPQDRFSIGGRYTVRGFDGENILSAERGWTLRNEIGLALGDTGQELYTGVDYGEVSGHSSEYLVGKRLAGAVVGGILLGLIEAIGSGYIGTLTGGLLGSHYTDIFAFIVLIIILTLRPSGLLGERVADRA